MAIGTEQTMAAAPKGGQRFDWKAFVAGGAAVLLTAQLVLIRPAAQQVAALERQVGQLSRTVTELAGTTGSVNTANRLLAQLQIQGSQLGEAEAALDRFRTLGERLVAQTEKVAAAAAAVERIGGVHAGIIATGRALDGVTATLEAADGLVARAEATRRRAEEAREGLLVVERVHGDLTTGLERLVDASPVLADVAGLCDRLAGAGPAVARATEVAVETERLGTRIAGQQAGIAAAHGAVDRMEGLIDAVEAAGAGTAPAAERLAELTRLKEAVVAGAVRVGEAALALERLRELGAGLTEATGTLGDIQHMIVDVMLLRPAVDRAAETILPVIEFTRAARAVEAAPRPVAAAPAPASPTPVVDVARSPGDVPQ